MTEILLKLLEQIVEGCVCIIILYFLGKCSHLKNCVKFTNLQNKIPHEDLSKCEECVKLGSTYRKSCETGLEVAGDESTSQATDDLDGAICVCLHCSNIVSIL